MKLKGSVLLLAALALLLLFLLGGRTAMLFALFLFVLVFLAFFLAANQKDSLRLSRTIVPSRLCVGENAEIRVVVENLGRLPIPWLEIWDTLPPYMIMQNGATRFAMSLMPREKRLLRYTVRLNKRGLYSLRPLLVSSGDPWGLWRRGWRLPAAANALVFPRILPLEDVHLPLRKPFEGRKSGFHAYEDTTSLSGVRAYQPQDPIKRIHWKLSAHLGELMVKEFEFTANTTITLWLDLTEGRLDQRFLQVYEDFATMVAASILSYAEEKHTPTALVVFPATYSSIPLGSGKDHFLHQMEELARARLGKGELLGAIKEAARHLPWQSNLILISSILSRERVMRLAELHRRTQQLTVFLLYEGSFLLPGEKPRTSYLLDPQEVVELRKGTAMLEAQGIRVRLVGENDPLSVVV